MTIHYLSSARPSRADALPADERVATREPSSPASRPHRPLVLDAPARHDDGDQTGWLLTFSDLVLQLFAFTIVSFAFAPQAASVIPPPTTESSVVATIDADEVRPALPAPEHDHVSRSDDGDGRSAVAAPAAEPDTPTVAREDAIEPSPLDDEDRATALADDDPAPSTAPARYAAIARYLGAFGGATGVATSVTASGDDRGVAVVIDGGIGFDAGRAEPTAAALPLLHEIGRIAHAMPELTVEITGHTDDRPVHTRAYPSNLELSLARAARIAHAIADVDPALAARIVTVGVADHRAIAPNGDAAGRARNRRVEVRLVER